MWLKYSKRKMAKLSANNGDPDQMLHSVASDRGLHCLPITFWKRLDMLNSIHANHDGNMLIACTFLR